MAPHPRSSRPPATAPGCGASAPAGAVLRRRLGSLQLRQRWVRLQRGPGARDTAGQVRRLQRPPKGLQQRRVRPRAVVRVTSSDLPRNQDGRRRSGRARQAEGGRSGVCAGRLSRRASSGMGVRSLLSALAVVLTVTGAATVAAWPAQWLAQCWAGPWCSPPESPSPGWCAEAAAMSFAVDGRPSVAWPGSASKANSRAVAMASTVHTLLKPRSVERVMPQPS